MAANAGRLRKKHGGRRWRKMKGVAVVELPDGVSALAEMHWFEAHGVGRVDFKVVLRAGRSAEGSGSHLHKPPGMSGGDGGLADECSGVHLLAFGHRDPSLESRSWIWFIDTGRSVPRLITAYPGKELDS